VRGREVREPAHDLLSEDLDASWRRIQAQLRASVGDSTYDLWFAELRPLSARGTTLFVTGPAHKLGWVERRYPEIIDFALDSSASGMRELRFVPPGVEEEGDTAEARAAETAARVALNHSYSFERFVIGPGNRLAHGAALAVAESPGQAYNPLFLHGPPGLGKTHLLGAIANYLSEHSPDLAVHYTTAEAFTNEFVLALQSRGVDRFKLRYRRLDVLLIDDVQFLEGKSKTSDEFFHTFNALHDAGAQIVLAADRLPLQLSALAERLRQRFEWGLTVDLDPPDRATRLAFLNRVLGERDECVDDSVIENVAHRACSNLRLLEGSLTRVMALSSLTGMPVTLELVNTALPTGAVELRPSRPGVAEIQSLVAERLGLSREQLLSRSRRAPVARARQLAMHLTRELTDLSLPEIAREFGRSDHTTVIHALRQVRSRLDVDTDFQVLVGQLSSELDADLKDRDRTD
jgi:chromosomal replication initiator protein